MIKLIQGECPQAIGEISDNSIDAVITDAPYGLRFMGKKWDYDVPSVAIWQECLRVLKPGGYLLSFGGTRTIHRIVCNVEDAGFEIRDMIAWVYATGFPKSLDVGKTVDKKAFSLWLKANPLKADQYYEQILQAGDSNKAKHHVEQKWYKIAGIKREIIGTRISAFGDSEQSETQDGRNLWGKQSTKEVILDKGSSEWEGWGTSLKPALEPITVSRKPLEGTVAENVLKWKTGGLNIDECRVETSDKYSYPNGAGGNSFSVGKEPDGTRTEPVESNSLGRFPANLILDGSDEVLELFPDSKGQQGNVKGTEPSYTGNKGIYGKYNRVASSPKRNDSGSAARFFYCAKASKSERNQGCDGLEEKKQDESRKEGNPGGDNPRNRGVHKMKNNHPTVKPIALMEYLIKLVSRKDAVILDPFMGSGTTGMACKKLNRNFIGIELDPDYFKIAEHRINFIIEKAKKDTKKDLELFF